MFNNKFKVVVRMKDGNAGNNENTNNNRITSEELYDIDLNGSTAVEIIQQSIISAVMKKNDVFKGGAFDEEKARAMMMSNNKLSEEMINKIKSVILPALEVLPKNKLEANSKTLIENIAHELDKDFHERGMKPKLKGSFTELVFSATKKVGKMVSGDYGAHGDLTISTNSLNKIAQEIITGKILETRESNIGYSR